MAAIVGHTEPMDAFLAALAGDAIHHAWLLTGPEGVGKATFAQIAAMRMLADASGLGPLAPGLEVPGDHPTRALVEAGSHPDFRLLARLPRDETKPGEELARSITIAQVRGLGGLFATAPSMGPRRVVVIDAIDDLERGGANALLKGLEEPPASTVFLLISHAPGRLLPTIRSRCRLLRFGRMAQDDVLAVVRGALLEADEVELAGLVDAAHGSPGQALRYAGLGIAELDTALASLIGSGDPSNALRSKLARQLSAKAAQPRYHAFLERAVAALAAAARERTGAALVAALDAHAAARDLAAAATGLSLDPAATVFELAGIVAGQHRRAA